MLIRGLGPNLQNICSEFGVKKDKHMQCIL